MDCSDAEVSPDEGGEGGFKDASTDRATAANVAAAPSRKAKKAPKSPSKGRTGKQNRRSKSASATEKNRDVASKKGFSIGDEVFLMNPRAVRQKVAAATVSGLHGSHKFHDKKIPPSWLKVDIREALQTGVALMFPNATADMELIEHAKGSSAIWDQKYIKQANGT